ncbi:MAG: hypothetical protein AB7E80_16025 [Hyphomicrobiaceae bacterium]
MLPRSCLVDRIAAEQVEDLLARSHSKKWTLAAPPGTYLTATWEEVKASMLPTDELWTYETFAACETKSRRDQGIAVLRIRRVIAMVKTGTQYRWW